MIILNNRSSTQIYSAMLGSKWQGKKRKKDFFVMVEIVGKSKINKIVFIIPMQSLNSRNSLLRARELN